MSSGPWRPEFVRLIKIAIVAAIVIVALVIAIPFVQDALRQPRVTLTDTSFSIVGCFLGKQDVHFLFTLINTGDADAFANVQFHIDGVNMANDNYFIPAGTSVQKMATVGVNDCVDHTPAVVLAAFWKA